MKRKKAWKIRYSVVAVMFLTGLVLMFDRAVISTALPLMQKDLGLSPMSMGFIMSAFSIGYALMQIPGGLLADKFGPRIVGALAIVFWSIFTFLTGTASSLVALIGIRLTFGAGEGSYVPAQYKALALWFPKKERGRAAASVNISMAVGGAITAVIAAALIGWIGWRSVFLILLVPGLLIAALFWLVVKDSPAKDKKVSAEELAEINVDAETMEKVKFVDLVKYPVVWQLYAVYFASAMVSFGLMNWLSIFVVDGLKGSLMQFGIGALIGSTGGILGNIVGGFLADKSRGTQKYQMFGSWLLATGFLYLGIASTSINVCIMFLTVESFFFQMAISAFFARMSTALPRKAMGVGVGIIQTSGYIAGAISPVLVGYFVQTTGGSYKTAFTVLCVILVMAAFLALTIRKESFEEEMAAKQGSDKGQAGA